MEAVSNLDDNDEKKSKLIKIVLFWEEEGMKWKINPGKEYGKKRKIT